MRSHTGNNHVARSLLRPALSLPPLARKPPSVRGPRGPRAITAHHPALPPPATHPRPPEPHMTERRGRDGWSAAPRAARPRQCCVSGGQARTLPPANLLERSSRAPACARAAERTAMSAVMPCAPVKFARLLASRRGRAVRWRWRRMSGARSQWHSTAATTPHTSGKPVGGAGIDRDRLLLPCPLYCGCQGAQRCVGRAAPLQRAMASPEVDWDR